MTTYNHIKQLPARASHKPTRGRSLQHAGPRTNRKPISPAWRAILMGVHHD